MNNKLRILLTKIFLKLILSSPLCTTKIRRLALILCGAHIGQDTFIGQNVYFDPLKIDNIFIGKKCYITQNVSLLTHFYTIDKKFYFGEIHIKDNSFIGMNTLICKPVTIGYNCVVGGGSVITKDIPDNSFAAGVPCEIVKKI